MSRPEFDGFSGSYEDLLRDPIRDRFSGRESAFFHLRKRDLIREFFRGRRMDASRLHYLDAGCGKGELLNLLRDDFLRAAGCDVSAEMMRAIQTVETRVQKDPLTIPFPDAEFDFITAVCVYHHIPPSARPAFTAEICRTLKSGGIFCLIEHNPLNPVTRLIVGRAPVDAGAVLLGGAEARRLAQAAGLTPIHRPYFLFFPQRLYRACGGIERALGSLPLGGQYALFARKP
jgi:SAM-dependent methyltransferase